MKRLNNFFQAVKAEWQADVSPATKRAILEDAKAVAGEILTGPWAELAIVFLDALEKGIATT